MIHTHTHFTFTSKLDLNRLENSLGTSLYRQRAECNAMWTPSQESHRGASDSDGLVWTCAKTNWTQWDAWHSLLPLLPPQVLGKKGKKKQQLQDGGLSKARLDWRWDQLKQLWLFFFFFFFQRCYAALPVENPRRKIVDWGENGKCCSVLMSWGYNQEKIDRRKKIKIKFWMIRS